MVVYRRTGREGVELFAKGLNGRTTIVYGPQVRFVGREGVVSGKGDGVN